MTDGTRIIPEPVLVGRNADKLKNLAAEYSIDHLTTDVDEALGDPANAIYFDALSTDLRYPMVKKAIAAGKHIYCEKPSAQTVKQAMELYQLARDAGVKHGVVQDKLWLPGLVKIRRLVDSGFFGRILSVRIEFGYWVFPGDRRPAQRPSWNYRSEDGGGILADMLSHWRYVLDSLFGKAQRISCFATTHIPQRWDEQGKPYQATAEDALYATVQLEGNIVAQVNSSWCTRVRRDDLVTFHVDGTDGSAVAGLSQCRVQSWRDTPRPVWNPDVKQAHDFLSDWIEVDVDLSCENAFKAEWELFLRHVCEDAPFAWDLCEGAKGVQLAELGRQSQQEGRCVDIPELEA